MTDHGLDHETRELLLLVTAAALERTAPDELLVLDEAARDYFADPDALLNPKRRDEAVGFGIDVELFTPYVLAVATPVVTFLLDTVAGAAQDMAKPWVIRTARRLIGGADGVGLSTEQIRQVRAIAYDEAQRLGLGDDQCALLADAVSGGLIGLP